MKGHREFSEQGESREFRRRFREFENKAKPLERDERISKATRGIENKEQTARKELENFRNRSYLRYRDWRISRETREIGNKEQTSSRISEEGANRSKQIIEFRKRLGKLKTISKPLERKREFENLRRRSRALDRD